MKEYINYLIAVFVFSPVLVFVYALFHLTKALVFFNEYIQGLEKSSYKNILFIFGPFLLLSEKLSGSEAWAHRKKFLYHFYRFIIGIIIVLAIGYAFNMITR